jgi:two-component system sensor histidine kinase HydH
MLTRSLLFRIAGPTVFMSLLFLGSCITAAFYLHHQQSASVRVLDEAISSRRIAGDLLKALDDLAALPADRRDETGALHGHILGLLAQAKQGVDKAEEARIVDRLGDSINRYLRRAAQAASGSAPGAAGREVARTLEAEVVPTCRELERYNAAEIERSEAILHRTVAWMAWG